MAAGEKKLTTLDPFVGSLPDEAVLYIVVGGVSYKTTKGALLAGITGITPTMQSAYDGGNIITKTDTLSGIVFSKIIGDQTIFYSRESFAQTVDDETISSEDVLSVSGTYKETSLVDEITLERKGSRVGVGEPGTIFPNLDFFIEHTTQDGFRFSRLKFEEVGTPQLGDDINGYYAVIPYRHQNSDFKLQLEPEVISANHVAVNGARYTVVANATFTDPTPAEGKGYVVYVRNGTATIGGTGYAVGSLVFRVFHSGAWSTREYKSNLTIDATPTNGSTNAVQSDGVFDALDLRVRTLLNDNVNSSPVTGTVSNTILKPYLIPANTLAVGDTLNIKAVCSKTGTNANSNFRLYINTSASLTGASALALVSPASTNLYFSLDRTYTLKSGNTLESFPVNSTAPTDEVATTASISNTAFNPAVDNYFIIAIQPNNASDSFVQTLCYITVMKSKTSV